MVALLEISDGTTTINLIKKTATGFHLSDWNPAIAMPKPNTPNEFENPIETFELKVNHELGQDELIRESQELMRLLQKAVEYWNTDWQDEPVWIKAQATCETNVRYAIIVSWKIAELDNPYAQPFINPAGLAAMDNIVLVVEREHWFAVQPGTSECVEASAVQAWQYEEFWRSNDTPGVAITYAMIQAANGDLYVGLNGTIIKSVDNGDNWTTTTSSPTSQVKSLLQAANGDIYAGDDAGDIWKTINNGASWGLATSSPLGDVRSLLQTENGYIYAGASQDIWRSVDNGASWGSLLFASNQVRNIIVSLLQTENGYIYAGDDQQILWSKDDGDNWEIVTRINTDQTYSLLQTENGDIYAGGNTEIFRSIDNGDSWQLNHTTADTILALLQTENGYIYAGDVGQIWRSVNNGASWEIETTLPVNISWDMIQAQNGDLWSSGGTGLIWHGVEALVQSGASNTCANEVYVANKQNIGNLTHVKIDDGGVFTDIFPISSYPQVLLPAIPATNDAVYFGQDSSVSNTGPFSSLVFDLGEIISATNSYSIAWEYWNGAWVALTIRDNTFSAYPFAVRGVSSVHWEQPSDWATTAVDGVTAYWVRARLSALTGTITPPEQQNRDIYTIVLPYANIASAQILGDIPSLLRQQLQNQSDEDGRGGSAPNLWDNRIVTGLRSVARGVNFQAYLNVSDEQNPVGVTVTATGANTVFATDVTAPTGRRATYTPVASPEAMATQVTISLGPSIARDFYGTYHAFLRVQRTAGASTDFDVQLQILSGSGGIRFTTESKQIQTTTQFELLDFGQIKIPVSALLTSSDLGDTTEIRIQASAASDNPIHFYDVILIPVDEWAIDSTDFANTSDSVIGLDDSSPKYLDVDSITNPKETVQSLVRVVDSNQVSSIYNSVTGGQAILQANAQQRLWFLAAQTSATGASYSWISPPYIAHSIQLFKQQRYLGLRGAR